MLGRSRCSVRMECLNWVFSVDPRSVCQAHRQMREWLKLFEDWAKVGDGSESTEIGGSTMLGDGTMMVARSSHLAMWLQRAEVVAARCPGGGSALPALGTCCYSMVACVKMELLVS
ncbi:unnamed protein product [Prunus brigantina]